MELDEEDAALGEYVPLTTAGGGLILRNLDPPQRAGVLAAPAILPLVAVGLATAGLEDATVCRAIRVFGNIWTQHPRAPSTRMIVRLYKHLVCMGSPGNGLAAAQIDGWFTTGAIPYEPKER